MRIGVSQINPVLGDFQFNADKILQEVHRARERRCDLVVFPESAIFGYHPFDLLERPELVEQQEKVFAKLHKALPKDVGVVLGVIVRNPSKKGRPFFNAAAVIEKGKKPIIFHKQLLPTGDVFDEARFIETGDMSKNVFRFRGKKFFLTICEDIWAWPDRQGRSFYKDNPLAKVKEKKIDFIINLSASPFYPGKAKVRRVLVKQTAQWLKAPMLYCNLVGAQDEIVFDGGSFILDPKGKELLRCQSFSEDFGFYDLESKEGSIRYDAPTGIEQIRQAMVLGLRDFCQKSGFTKVHLGLSGGIDSAVVAAVAVDALGPSNVKCFYLPTEFSAKESGVASHQLAKNLGLELQEISIQKMFESVRGVLDGALGIQDFGLPHENLQSRLRGMALMFYSNASRSLLIGTSNKSELATGYSTLYGDLCAGILPLGDLTKGQVFELAEHYNREYELIPRFIIDRPPSAELRPNQKDQDSLPSYDVLDDSVVRIVENSGKVKNETDRWLLQMLFRSEFKRWQAPPILKLSKHAFGRGRRFPVAHRSPKA